MYISETRNGGKLYLSIIEKRKDSDGKWRTHYVAGIGYVDELKKVYDDPKQFFKDLLKKIKSASTYKGSK